MSQPKAILFGCCPSSGSTLLSLMLDAHPRVACGPELWLLSHPFFWRLGQGDFNRKLLDLATRDQFQTPGWNLEKGLTPYLDLVFSQHLAYYGVDPQAFLKFAQQAEHGGRFAESFFAGHLKAQGKSTWCEKTPANLYALPWFLDREPEAAGLVMVRDGRDVTASLMRRGLPAAIAAAVWLNETALSLVLANHPRVTLVRYEDLVANPAAELERLCRRLGMEPAVEEMLAYRRRSARVRLDQSVSKREGASTHWTHLPGEEVGASSVGRWQRDLTPGQQAAFFSLVLDNPPAPANRYNGMTPARLLATLGYGQPWPPRGMDGQATAEAVGRELAGLAWPPPNRDAMAGRGAWLAGFTRAVPPRGLPRIETA